MAMIDLINKIGWILELLSRR